MSNISEGGTYRWKVLFQRMRIDKDVQPTCQREEGALEAMVVVEVTALPERRSESPVNKDTPEQSAAEQSDADAESATGE